MIKPIGMVLLIISGIIIVGLMTEYNPYRYSLLTDWSLIALTGLSVLMYQEVMKR